MADNTTVLVLDEAAPTINPIYIAAVDAAIAGLDDSDFVTHCGGMAIAEIREYRLDMALTIQTVIEGRK